MAACGWEAREESFEINKKRMQIRHPCVLSFLQPVLMIDGTAASAGGG